MATVSKHDGTFEFADLPDGVQFTLRAVDTVGDDVRKARVNEPPLDGSPIEITVR